MGENRVSNLDIANLKEIKKITFGIMPAATGILMTKRTSGNLEWRKCTFCSSHATADAGSDQVGATIKSGTVPHGITAKSKSKNLKLQFC